jgi:hypothetical protein
MEINEDPFLQLPPHGVENAEELVEVEEKFSDFGTRDKMMELAKILWSKNNEEEGP